MKLDKSLIEQLPSGPDGLLLSIWGQPPLDTARNYSGFGCASSQLEDNIDITLGRMESKYGWNLHFEKPLTCSWDEFDSIKQIVNKRSLTMSGGIFVYLDNGEERWDRDGLIVDRSTVTRVAPSPTQFKPSSVIIESISPSSASIGNNITIHGSGFTLNNNDIAFTSPQKNFNRWNPSYLSRVYSQDGKTLSFSLPETLGACAYSRMEQNETCPLIGLSLPKGTIQISVINKNGISNSITFTIK